MLSRSNCNSRLVITLTLPKNFFANFFLSQMPPKVKHLKSNGAIVLSKLFILNQPTANPPIQSPIHFALRKFYRRQPSSSICRNALHHWRQATLSAFPPLDALRQTNLLSPISITPRISPTLMKFGCFEAEIGMLPLYRIAFFSLTKALASTAPRISNWPLLSMALYLSKQKNPVY